MAKKIIDQLVDYILAAPDASLPSEVVQKAKNHLLDTLAAIVSGSQLTPGRLGLEYARSEGGKPEALVMGSDLLTTATLAAFANGILLTRMRATIPMTACIPDAPLFLRRGPWPSERSNRADLYSPLWSLAMRSAVAFTKR